MCKGGKGNLLVLAYLFLLLNLPTAKACRVFLSPLLVGGAIDSARIGQQVRQQKRTGSCKSLC
jgi:hypothetical protein